MHDLIEYPVRRGFDEIEKIYSIVLHHNGFIAGSYAAYMAAPYGSHIIPPNDVDIFAASNEAAEEIHQALVDGDYFIARETDVAYSMEPNRFLLPIADVSVQVIKPNPIWKTFPQDIVNSFDLTVSRAILISPNAVLGDPELGCKQARILRIENPLKSLSRVIKYVSRGVEFSDWELHKLFSAYENMTEDRKNEIAKRVAEAHQPSLPDEDDEFDYYDYEWNADDDYFDGE